MLGDAVTLVALGLVALVAGLASLVLKKLLAKIGIDITEKEEQRVRQLVHDAVVRTEEVSRRDPTMTPADKAAYTERTIMEQAEATGQCVDPATARHLVDVLLPLIRSRNIGNTKPAVIPVVPVQAGARRSN